MWYTQVISPHVHLCEQLMPWRWRWLGFVARLTHVMKELIAYETWHWVMWLRWRRSRQDLPWWTGCKYEGQIGGFWSDGPRGGEAWARLGANGWRQWWKASEVKINEPTRSRDDIKWIILFVIWLVHVLHQHWRRWNGMRKAITYRVFYFNGHRCVEKFMTGFRIDGRTIKRGKLVCISVI